ncbi:hypothetical protein VTP01DRAFT_8749 [Rhizomucor pusillus]|uniref:uncharacterized protein n=1 Tax=Rhizomucor pusillus TaxID=4840 RepID=UPI0037447EF2
MIKNFGKLKQWTGERLGAAKATLQTEDFQRLETDTERKRATFEKVHQALEVFHGQLSKKKPSPEDGKTKVAPLEAVGACWINHGSSFSEDSALGIALLNFGQAESRIAMLQDDLAAQVKEGYMRTLEDALREYKEYQALKKKLEGRRLDYDAKLARLQKAKKEKPEWEQEMQAAKLKYEETEYELLQKMVQLQEYEDTHYAALQQLLEAQHSYFSRAAELLDSVRANWGQGNMAGATARQTLQNATFARSPSVSSLSTPRNGSGDDYFAYSASPDTLPAAARRPSLRSEGLSAHSVPRRMPSATSIRSNGSDRSRPPPPPPLSRRQSHTSTLKRRKALYDFEGESIDELSFRAGDVITVIEEVDEGWWLGEVEHFGPKRRGIFPVNYTEDLINGASPPVPARPPTSIMEQPVEEEHQDSPFHDNQATLEPPRSQSTQFVPLATKPTTSRTPPPPPASSSRVTPALSTSASTRMPMPPPTSAIANTAAADAPPCQECGCNDFSANVFKKGHCKTCFHYHS